jgi:hypothetical protein
MAKDLPSLRGERQCKTPARPERSLNLPETPGTGQRGCFESGWLWSMSEIDC